MAPRTVDSDPLARRPAGGGEKSRAELVLQSWTGHGCPGCRSAAGSSLRVGYRRPASATSTFEGESSLRPCRIDPRALAHRYSRYPMPLFRCWTPADSDIAPRQERADRAAQYGLMSFFAVIHVFRDTFSEQGVPSSNLGAPINEKRSPALGFDLAGGLYSKMHQPAPHSVSESTTARRSSKCT
jgi:hypothetical protein